MTSSKLEGIIEKENESISSKSPYKYDKRYDRFIRAVLGQSEHVILGARQSFPWTLSPGIMIATNKRILILKMSFWNLYSGYNVVDPSSFINIHYNRITETTLLHGRFLCSIILKVFGGGDIRFDKLRRREALRLVGFLERIAIANEES